MAVSDGPHRPVEEAEAALSDAAGRVLQKVLAVATQQPDAVPVWMPALQESGLLSAAQPVDVATGYACSLLAYGSMLGEHPEVAAQPLQLADWSVENLPSACAALKFLAPQMEAALAVRSVSGLSMLN